MKIIAAYFRLIRWPNLVFIIVTQLLFYYCVYSPLLAVPPHFKTRNLYFLLVLSSVFIAAAGYIINDYFDIQIDAINKPDRMVVNKIIKRRWAILWHLLLSSIGIAISFYISYKIKVWPIFLINVLCVFALWFYSTHFKKQLLLGNLLVAVLTAWVVLVVYLFAGADIFSFKGFEVSHPYLNIRKLFKFTLLYAGFAFVTTLIREVVKDLEDMEGDRKYDCKTMPITWGVPASKVFVAVWIVVSVASLFGILMYAWQSGWWSVALYILFLIVIPFAYMLHKLFKAISVKDYHFLSSLIKMIMLAGILSMLFLKHAA
jgi:4-hydroxybenzoate polyprenyltransferase